MLLQYFNQYRRLYAPIHPAHNIRATSFWYWSDEWSRLSIKEWRRGKTSVIDNVIYYAWVFFFWHARKKRLITSLATNPWWKAWISNTRIWLHTGTVFDYFDSLLYFIRLLEFILATCQNPHGIILWLVFCMVAEFCLAIMTNTESPEFDEESEDSVELNGHRSSGSLIRHGVSSENFHMR